MPSPFPGMDPYLERPEPWPDFHDRFITFICSQLQPALRPKYAALTQDRLYVVESKRPIFPDVTVINTGRPITNDGGAATAVLDVATPSVFEFWREDIREPYIEIVEPSANNRVVSTIEVLSPTNKNTGDGHREYIAKRDELWRAGVNIIEIDLLRLGNPIVWVTQEQREKLRPWHYLTAVTRRRPSRHEVYEILLQKPLPRIAIPLTPDDKDVVLDLQAAFNRTWDEGPYPELLNYYAPPPGNWAPEEVAWCEQKLRDAKMRAT